MGRPFSADWLHVTLRLELDIRTSTAPIIQLVDNDIYYLSTISQSHACCYQDTPSFASECREKCLKRTWQKYSEAMAYDGTNHLRTLVQVQPHCFIVRDVDIHLLPLQLSHLPPAIPFSSSATIPSLDGGMATAKAGHVLDASLANLRPRAVSLWCDNFL